jgi:hypothetical protein
MAVNLVPRLPPRHGSPMKSRGALIGLFFGGTLGAFAAMVSCGDRTGLLVDAVVDVDAGPDVSTLDVITRDLFVPEEDAAEEDALPPLDVIHRDVQSLDCPDAASTLIYVVAENNDLMSFYPPTAEFKTIGAIACPSHAGSTPFSMGVSRTGTAFVVFSNTVQGLSGELFRVSTATAACVATPYVPSQVPGFTTFGMGYVGDTPDGGAFGGDAGETLYVAADVPASNGTLGRINTGTFILTAVAPFSTGNIPMAELTGTGDGRLFAFYSVGTFDSAIAEINPLTAQVIASSPLPGVAQGNGWAFGFWGGDFYTFTSPNGGNTNVTRFRPSDNSITVVAQTAPNVLIVGAGVSTCAPQ